MKILIISEGTSDYIYGGAIEKGFKKLGIETYRFTWGKYFIHHQYFDNDFGCSFLKDFFYRLQNKFRIGPIIFKINQEIIQDCLTKKPNLVFIYRGTHIYPNTIKFIKKNTGCKVFAYNNDDPFSNSYPKYFWRHYKNSVQHYDHIFSYRHKNIIDYKSLSYKNTSVLRSYYLDNKNFFLERLNTDKYNCDVIFVGHFENDGRDEFIKILIDNGIYLKLYGTLWERSKHYSYFVQKIGKIVPLYEDYNLALNSAKIALVFLSKINNDSYTRRCFEIPATKTMMMAKYTDDLNSMFEEGKDAEYFRNKEELLRKINHYLANENKLKEIGINGYKRLLRDGHEVTDRCREILKIYNLNSSGT